MFNWSNFDIYQLLKSEPGRLNRFLLEVPIADLRVAIEEQEKAADLRYRNSRNEFQYRKNVLDMTLEEVIMACYNENIINYFDRMLAVGNTRIQNHPQYGHRLVQRCPEKYFIGERSGHYNRAREIEEAYGIRGNHFDAENDTDQMNSRNGRNSQLDEGNDQDKEDDGQYQEEHLDEQDNSNQQPKIQNGYQPDQHDSNSNDSFIVQDDSNSEYEYIEDSVDEDQLIRNNRKKSKNHQLYQHQEKVQVLERTTEKKLTKLLPIQQNEQINLNNYLLEPQKLPKIQDTLSKKQQKKLKKELKNLQKSTIDSVSIRSTRRTKQINELETQKCEYAFRKTKMILDLDQDELSMENQNLKQYL